MPSLTNEDRCLIRRVAVRIQSTRNLAYPGAGLDPTDENYLPSLLALRGGRVQHSLLPTAYEVVPLPDGWGLALSLPNPGVGNAFCIYYAFSVSDPGACAATVDEHRLFAMACALTEAERRDISWFSGAIDALRGLPGVWIGGRSFDSLLRVLPLVWARTDAGVSPATACDLGREAGRRGAYAAACAYLLQAAAMACRAGAWADAIRAHVALATVHFERGEHASARACHRRALRLASLRSQGDRGMVLHEMFWLAASLDECDAANRLAEAAAEAYGTFHPWFPRLVHDLAYNWIGWGMPARGVPLLLAVSRIAPASPEEAVCCWAAVARGAGMLGDRELLLTATARVAELVRACSTERHRADALINLARGFAAVGRWEDARRWGEAGVEVARRRGEPKAVLEGESVLGMIQTHAHAIHYRPVQQAPVERLAEGITQRLGEREAMTQ